MIPVGTNLQQNRLPLVTLIIIGVNVLFFLIELVLPEPVRGIVVMLFGYGTWNWWNPVAAITAVFLHADIYHIAFNMLFFWIFAGPVEDRVGRVNFALFYLVCGASANFASVMMTVLTKPFPFSIGIGASGAVSGIMGIFLYRCHHSRLKLVVSPLLLPQQISLPVAPLIVLWFLQNFLMGVLTSSQMGGVDYWAHVGGFISGIIIGRVKGYGHDGKVEKLRDRIFQKLEEGGGWQAAEKELMKLYQAAPDDPEVNHDLARLYSDSGQKTKAARFYQKAAELHMKKGSVDGAYVVTEYMDAVGKPMPAQLQMKAVDLFIAEGDYESAMNAVAPLTDVAAYKGPVSERALVVHIRLARHQGLEEVAKESVGTLATAYPDTRYRDHVRALFAAQPGALYKRPGPAPRAVDVSGVSVEHREALALDWVEKAQRYFVDPAFWSILLFLNIATPFLFPRIYFSSAAPVALFVAAYVMTIVHRLGGVEEWLFYFGKSQKQADREFDLNKMFNQAKAAETGGNYQLAAKHYEELLASDKTHAQARFNLARIYHRKMDDLANARRHYKVLVEQLPVGHTYRIEAEEGMRARS